MKKTITLLTCLWAMTAWGQTDLATEALEQANFEQAKQLYESALLVANSEDAKAYCHAKIAVCESRLGQFEQARTRLEDLKNRQDISPQTQASIKSAIGEIQLQMGFYEQAVVTFEAEKKLLSARQYEPLAHNLTNLGLAYWQMGNQELAVSYLYQALDARTLVGDRRALAKSHNNLGLVFSETQPSEAKEHYLLALEDYQQTVGDQHHSYILTLNNLAIVQAKLGDYSESLDTYRSVLKDWKRIYGEAHPNVAFTYSNMASAYLAEDLPDEALIQQQQAIKIYAAVYGNEHPDLSGAYYLLAKIYQKTQKHEQALKAIQQAIQANTIGFDADDTKTNPTLTHESFRELLLISSLQLKAMIYKDRHFQQSLRGQDLRNALATLENCGERIDLLRRRLVKKSDRIALGNIAASVYEEGISIALTLAGFSVSGKKMYEEKAFAFSEKSKSAVLISAIADTKAKQFAGLPAEILTQEEAFKGQISALEQLAAESPSDENARKQLLDLEVKYRAFTQQLEANYPNYYELKYDINIASVSDVQLKLDDHTQLRSYFIGEQTQRLFIFEITKDQMTVRDEPLPKDFERMITGYYNAIIHQIKPTYLLNGRKLHQTLFPHKINRQITKLQIIHDGRLGMIPFGSLLSTKPSLDQSYADLPYLIRDYALAYTFSATLFAQSSRSQAKPTRAVLMAPIDFAKYTSQRGSGLSTLYGSEYECNQIQQLLQNAGIETQLFVKGAARESVFKSEAVQSAGIIHLATHGIVREDQPSRSEVFLHQDEEEDGDLFTGEIFNLHCRADLMVISACQTGLGKISRGEGIIGLSRAFVFAGAHHLAVSYWSVSDASTARLMEQFYRHHLLSDMRYAEALQAAKVAMTASDEYAAPYYWAPFVIIGQ